MEDEIELIELNRGHQITDLGTLVRTCGLHLISRGSRMWSDHLNGVDVIRKRYSGCSVQSYEFRNL